MKKLLKLAILGAMITISSSTVYAAANSRSIMTELEWAEGDEQMMHRLESYEAANLDYTNRHDFIDALEEIVAYANYILIVDRHRRQTPILLPNPSWETGVEVIIMPTKTSPSDPEPMWILHSFWAKNRERWVSIPLPTQAMVLITLPCRNLYKDTWARLARTYVQQMRSRIDVIFATGRC